MDEPRGGTLRLSGRGIPTLVFVTQADILTSTSSIRAYALTSPGMERSPTISSCSFPLGKEEVSTASAGRLVPIIFGAGTLYQ